MLKEERLQLILQYLQRDNKVVLSDVSKMLKVSEDTVRRDIKELSAQKLLREVRGGAIPHSPGPRDFRDRENFAIKKKEIIAKKGIELIKNGQVIVFDGGASALALAARLPKDLTITVVTHSFPIVDIVEDRTNIEVYFAGGKLLRESLVTVGADTINFFEGIRADIYFLGVSSIDLKSGVTGRNYDECAVKKAIIKSSGQVVALTAPEKLNTAEAFNICPITALSGIITSSEDNDLLRPYREAGIAVY